MDSNTRKKGARRLQNSCDNCRRKKIRCDSSTMPNKVCSVCLNAGIECKHTNTPKKRGPKPNHTAQSALVNAILAEPLTYQTPDDSAGVRELLVDICHYVRSLEKEISRLRRAPVSGPGSAGGHPSPSPPAPDAEGVLSNSEPIIAKSAIGGVFSDEDSDDTDTNTISENFKHLSLYHSRPRHYGMSSNFVLAQTLLEVDFKHSLDIGLLLKRFERPLFWTINSWQREIPSMTPDTPLVFPDSDLLHDLVSIYFAEFDPYLPLLHRQTFEQGIKDGLHLRERCFGKVVLAVCALASRYSNDPRNMIPGAPCPEHSLGWLWFRQVAVVQTTSFIDPPRVYNLQLFVLSVVFLQGTTTSESSWIIIGTAIRLAEAIGVHRKGPGPAQPRTIERELWNRAFWALVNIDVTVSMFLGRPRATTFDDFDLDLPADCDQEYWENPEDPESNFVQPPGKPSIMSFWIHYTKLQQIAAAVHRLIYPIKKLDVWRRMGITGRAWHQRAVMEIDSLLNQWVDNIPEHVRWDPNRKDPVFRQQSVILYTTYYWVQIQVHIFQVDINEDSIPGDKNRFSPSRLWPSVLTQPDVASMPPNCNLLKSRDCLYTYFAGIVLLLKLWRAKHTSDTIGVDSEKELAALSKCFDLLSDFSQRFQSAGRFIDILNAIISVGQLAPELDETRSKQGNTGDAEQENYSNPPPLDSFAPSYQRTVSNLPVHLQDSQENNSLGAPPIIPLPHSVPDFTLPFHTRDLGESSLYYTTTDFYGNTSPVVSTSSSSLAEAIPWNSCPEMSNPNLIIHNPTEAPHTASLAQAEQYNPRIIELHNQYGMQGVIASVESYSRPSYAQPTSHIPNVEYQPLQNEARNHSTAPLSHWNNTSDHCWGSGSGSEPPISHSELGQDWSHFLSNVDGLLHSASGDFHAYPT
ncbi:fungal-specific transcription factor domain-containing protein [Lentinula guzmanii]|uniref:Fungal-specific transcription factor domain-containing protein n=1 Tax=Lentinula guzmanii TaxID=2804957 RepID=A0AA38MVV6_9AGAR|nr:fungal-specific transcription factor domain-containing protein [Lentinula guzmanii]